MGEGLGGDVEVVVFGGVALLPEGLVVRGVLVTHDFAHGFGEHGCVVFGADDGVAKAVVFDKGGGEAVVAETAAAFPFLRFCYAARIGAIDYLSKAGKDVGIAMLAKFHHNPATTHFVGDGTGCAGSTKRIQNQLPAIGGDHSYNSAKEKFRFFTGREIDTAFILEIVGRNVVPNIGHRLGHDPLAIYFLDAFTEKIYLPPFVKVQSVETGPLKSNHMIGCQ